MSFIMGFKKKINTSSIIRFSDKISIGYLGRFETQKGIPFIYKSSKDTFSI